MREIKFRAWCENSGEFIMIDDYLVINNENHGIGADLTNDYPCVRKVLEVMQYTGQKDKNGKERYEGDIAIMTTENGYSEKGVIIYNENSARFGFLSPDGSIYSLNANDERIKIIGNIYQNSDLLT